ncbi:entericidin A/B family lipoprotein [Rhodoferax sp.]
MKKIATLIAAVFALGLVGCNTVHGFGQDVKKVGEKIEGTGK